MVSTCNILEEKQVFGKAIKGGNQGKKCGGPASDTNVSQRILNVALSEQR